MREKGNRTHIIACTAFGDEVSTAGVASAISNAFSADWTASATEETFSSSSSMLPFSFGSTTAFMVTLLFVVEEVEASLKDAARAAQVCCKENIFLLLSVFACGVCRCSLCGSKVKQSV